VTFDSHRSLHSSKYIPEVQEASQPSILATSGCDVCCVRRSLPCLLVHAHFAHLGGIFNRSRAVHYCLLVYEYTSPILEAYRTRSWEKIGISQGHFDARW
jgi:hypothetical protein